MDMFHVDIILLVILCFLTVFLCAYGVYCVYRVLYSMQMQILRPTKVLFSHKKEGQSHEQLRTVVAYRNPLTGDYCVHKSRDGTRGYLNTTPSPPSPDSGLSDEYEPLHQPALARVDSEPPGRTHRQSEMAYMQSCLYAGKPAYRQSVEPEYRPSLEPEYHRRRKDSVMTGVETAYRQGMETAYRSSLERVYQRREESVTPVVESTYHRHVEFVESGMMTLDHNRPAEPALVMTMDPPHHRSEKTAMMTCMPGILAGVKPTSTRSLNTSQPLRLSWMTHLKSALRKPHRSLKSSSTPSAEHNILDKTWNWNYKEYQI